MKDNDRLWNAFVSEHSSPSSFLQSWQWGEFQEALGNQVYRLKIRDFSRAQVIVKKLPFGRTYLEIPKGPVLNMATSDWRLAIGELVDKLKDIGRREKAVLARVNPPYPPAFPPPPVGRKRRRGDGRYLVSINPSCCCGRWSRRAPFWLI